MPFSVKIGIKKAHRKSKICVVLIKAVKIERKWWNRLVNKPEKHRADTLESINLERRRRLSWTMTSFSKKTPVPGKHEGAQELRTPLRKVVNIPHCPRRPWKNRPREMQLFQMVNKWGHFCPCSYALQEKCEKR